MTELRVRKHCIEILQKERYVSGSVNIYKVHFTFVNEWDGLAKFVVFKAGQKTKEVLLSEDNTCMIPWEVLADPQYRFQIGVYGTRDGVIARPTIMINMGSIERGTKTSLGDVPPSLDIYRQILEALSSIPRPMTADELRKIITKGSEING